MEKTNPTRPQRAAKKPLPPVDKPETLDNKYAKKERIGPRKCKDAITTVGLGNLKVITQ